MQSLPRAAKARRAATAVAVRVKQAAAQGEGGKDGGPGDPTSRAEQLGKMVDFLEGAASGTNPGRHKRLRNQSVRHCAGGDGRYDRDAKPEKPPVRNLSPDRW